MKIVYFDCFSGISGNMILGALIHLGVPKELIEDSLGNLSLEAFRLEVGTAERMGIHGLHVEVVVEKKNSRSRDFKDIRGLIEASSLSESVKHLSLKTFARLAKVEAHIHNCPEEHVHFHEVGGVDAIVDIVGAALGMEWLDVDKTVASEIPLGKGFVTCDHGKLPVPAPATIALLKGVPVYGTDVPHELVTPTGAAILTSLAEEFGPLPKMNVTQIGYGIGTRELQEMPNLLRIVVGEAEPALEEDCVTVVETNIDDMNPEIFGFVMERLFEDGALDVTWVPVFMKKNRPGTMIQVVCKDIDSEKVVRRILSETTATGVRHYRTERTKLKRILRKIDTSLGKVQVKEISGPAGRVSVVPEYEECKRIALEKNIPLKVVYETIVKETSGT